jgi:hypothetical protein
MALVLKDRVRESTTTSGTGTLTLDGAVGGFQGFSVIGNGNTTYYAIVDVTTGAWEVGVGTYTASGQTLSRDTVLESSSGGTLVAFTSNIKDVFCTYPAERAAYLDSATNATIPGLTNSGNLAFTGTGNRITGDFSNATAANRVAFQTSTVDGNTIIAVIPNGTATGASLLLENSSGLVNASFLQATIDTASASIRSGIRGTGTYLPMTFFTGGSERVRIDTSGNVGIGTSSPTTALSLDKTNVAFRGQLTINGGSTGTSQITLYKGTTSDTDLVGQLYAINTQNSVSLSAYKADGVLLLETNGNTERMRIDSAGNVGIGTSSPNASAILDVQSTTKGVRMPNMTTTQKNAITSPAAGLMVFDTTLAKLCVYSGAAWETITST